MEDITETGEKSVGQSASLRDYVVRFPQEAQVGPEFHLREQFWASISKNLREAAERGELGLEQFDSLVGGLIAAKEWLAERDFLTGLGNRKSYEQHINERLVESKRNNLPLTLVALDLDNFKTLNDERGHPAGNIFLIRLGEIIRHNKRAEDFAARVGGDEVIIILPNTDIKGAEIFIERLSGEIRGLIEGDIQFAGLAKPLGVSFGYAGWNGQESAKELEDRVDKELYRVKGAKKNG